VRGGVRLNGFKKSHYGRHNNTSRRDIKIVINTLYTISFCFFFFVLRLPAAAAAATAPMIDVRQPLTFELKTRGALREKKQKNNSRQHFSSRTDRRDSSGRDTVRFRTPSSYGELFFAFLFLTSRATVRFRSFSPPSLEIRRTAQGGETK